jgi:hypothetical protein
MNTEPPRDKATLSRELSRLANERTALFALAGVSTGLSKEQHSKLALVERQIDECFLQIRRQRAAKEAHRFTNEGLVVRPAISPRRDPGAR